WYEKVLVEAGAKYAVFDSATALVGDDLNDGLVASSVMTFLSQLGKKHGIARCLVHHTRKASTHGEKGSSADKAAGAAQWVRLADTAVLVESDGPGRVKIDPWKIRDHEQGKPYVARITENLHFEFIAEIGPGAAPGKRRPPGETAKGIVERLHVCKEWLTAKDLADLLDVTPRAINMAIGSRSVARWIADGFIEVQEANGPNPPRYRSTGALPPEFVS
ncbi:MAG TPA: hypothetical protein VFY93_02725, partial [Planctomycetota bacterium]|nr:hypothetical protein [Planctomycetota bacterium]